MLYKKSEKLTKEVFQNPGREYRGAPFWAWNCRMDKKSIDHMTEVLKDMGMGGGHIHCRTGMDHPYLGEEFLGLVKYANEKFNEKQMLTWLYDEDRWPSGAGGGLVTKDHRYRIRFLLFTPECQDKKIVKSAKKTSGQVVRGNERVRLARYQVLLENGYLKDYERLNAGEAVKEGWNEWFAYLEISGDAPWFNNQAYLNTLDPLAVKRFIEVTHEKYEELLGEQFGKNIPAIFTDEPQFCRKQCLDFAEQKKDVLIPFTDDLEESFEKEYGCSLLAHLPELFWELSGEEISVIRYEYHDHIAERFARAFADQIGGWCREHGIALTGHMMEEPTLKSQTAALGEAMRSYRSFTIPGIDMLCDRRELNTAKQCESAVHQFGKEAMLSELYGVTNWDFDFRGHKLQGDWQAALGVTVRVPHLTWTSMAGEAKRDYPASIGYQSPWYREYAFLENHFARVNTALTRGKAHVRLGVIHPIESYWLYWGPKEQTSGIREEMDANFRHLTEWLLYHTIDFDFVSESLLPSLDRGEVCEAAEGSRPLLKVGEMAYEGILVPNCRTLRRTTLDILERFAKKGGRVIFTGEIPFLEDARPSKRGQKLAEQTETVPFGRLKLLESLEEFREITIREADGTESTNLIYQMREEGDDRWLFLAHVNRTEDTESEIFENSGLLIRRRNIDLPVKEELTITIRGKWKLTVYDTLTGEIYEPDYLFKGGDTVLYTTMYDQDSLLLYLEKGGEGTEAVRRELAVQEEGYRTVFRPGENPVRFSEPNVSLLDIAEYRFDDGEWQEKEEILRIDNRFRKKLGYPMRMEAFAQPWTRSLTEPVEHKLSLKYTVECACDFEGLHLALENRAETKLFLDGQEITADADGWYTDHCIQTVLLPPLEKGTHILQAEIPYNRRTNVENLFLLGDFTVEICGPRQTLKAPKRSLPFGDITRQGYPFYGGNVTYEIPFYSEGSEYRIEATMFRSPCIRVSLDGKSAGRIAFSPYVCSLGEVPEGGHIAEITVYGSRINTFGTVHNCNQAEIWYGPNSWRTVEEEWSYEYQLKPTGLLKAPVLKERRGKKNENI